MSNFVPAGWVETTMGNLLLEFRNGYAFRPNGYVESGIPIISMGNLGLDGRFKKGYAKQKYWAIEEKDNLKRYIVKRHDLLIAMTDVTPSMELIGRACVADIEEDALLNQRVGLLRVDDTKVCRSFLSYVTNFDNWRSYAKGITGLGAQANIGTQQIQEGPVLLPPLVEQQKIASILTAVDEVIESTTAQINKLKDLKTGMMQELLTKGIGRGGQPHTEFKDSPVGRIPKDWEVKQLGQLAKLERGRFSQRPRNDPAFYGGAIPFLQTGDIPKESPYISSFTQTLNEKGLSVSKLFKQGTLVITIAATIGEIGLLKFDSCFPDSLVGITVDDAVADRSFLLYSMRSRKDDLELLAPQTAQKNINLEILYPFLLAVPPLEEQRVIGKSMELIDQKIETSTKKYTQFCAVKKALMQDLLIGRVRVSV